MLRIVFRIEIRKIILLISIRDLSNRIIITNKYLIFIIYIDYLISDNILKIACFIIEVYLLNNLKINILIKNNTLIS